ncbi:MAG: hypothetical protein Kow0031_04610 [Anaerolineae bacterium]
MLLLTTPPARAQEPNPFRVEPGQELLFDHAFEIGTLVGPGVVEDADGFLWFSSARGDGLYRRDGIEMRQFGPTGDVSLGPVTWLLTDGADPSLFWAVSDDQDSIWIGTEGAASPPAPEPVRLTPGQGRYPLGFHLEYLADPSYQLTLDDVTSPEYDAQFVPGQAETQNFGYVKAAYWVRFQVENDTPDSYEWLLEIARPFLDRIDVYHYSIDGEPPQVYHLGDTYPFSQRPIEHRNFVLALSLPPGSVHTFYVRIAHVERMIFDLYMWNPVTFLQQESYLVLGFGLFYGTLLILMFFNLLLFASVRDIVHLYYAAYAAAIFLAHFALDGFGFQYVWPNQIWWKIWPRRLVYQPQPY